MKEFLSRITMEQWVQIIIIVLGILVGGKIILNKVIKSNKAKVKNVENSKINIHQDNK